MEETASVVRSRRDQPQQQVVSSKEEAFSQHRYYGSMSSSHNLESSDQAPNIDTITISEGQSDALQPETTEQPSEDDIMRKKRSSSFSKSIPACTSRSGRTMDEFLEDAYNDKSDSSSWCSVVFHQYQYWLIMLALGISNSSDASEILCLSYILSDPTFEDKMLLDSNWRGGMLAAAVFLGMLMGGLIVGTLGDFLGRRPMLMLGLNINMIAGILSACSPNVFVLTGLRMIAGVGIGATVPPLFTLVAELAPPSKRGFCVTFCAAFWMVGSIYVALVAILFLKNSEENYNSNNNNTLATTASDGGNDADNNEATRYLVSQAATSLFHLAAWRVFAMACAVPSALGAVMVHFLVPESPRFLALQKRFDEAVESVNALGSSLQYQGPTLHRWELEEQFGGACNSTANYHPALEDDIVTEQHGSTRFSCSKTLRWIRLALADFVMSAKKLYTPSLRQTTWPLQMAWFSLSFGSYGLMTWINTLFFAVHLQDVYFNALLFALSNLPGNIFTAFLMDRAGRAHLLVGSILSASLSLLSFAAFANTSGNSPPNAYGVVCSACSFQCFTIAAWNTIDVMTSELFPTTVRSTGMGVCAASGRIGAMLAQFVNGALVGRPVRLLVVAATTLALGACTPFLLPDHGDMTGQPVADDVSSNKTSVNSSDSERASMLGEGTDLSNDDDNTTGGIPEPAPSSMGLSRRGGNQNSNNLGSYQRVASGGSSETPNIV
ncbi:Synaptic vesicle glycoprotein [Seminavis robusta]|uniref:Synaptic vesicle glycoprotein n=1 Tax=Seminavis robusta TaxID=568900 RepID=A0A9N8DIA1_9STRA|nr:Synaptic vesicle glycoprotein [Seminavis robusta]|eukprot:Sro103_g052570.1 Synaptic vesicle glycoprotein (722) ;mRNA; f:81379-83544